MPPSGRVRECILAGLVGLALVAVAWVWRAVVRRSRAIRAAVAGWGAAAGPTCAGAPPPAPCAPLLADPGLPPDPRRPRDPGGGFDAEAAAYAIRVVARLVASILGPPGPGGGGAAALSLPGLGPPVALVLAAPDPGQQPLAAVWASGDLAVVAFRGTLTAADLLADLRYAELAEPADPGSPARVHRGIATLYGSVRGALFEALPPGVRAVFVAGHSLGGALAFLFAADAAGRVGADGRVEAWGVAPPRAGNQAFADEVSRVARAATLINAADAVPTLPWSYMPNEAAPLSPYAYAHVGAVAAFDARGSDISACHALATYLAGVAAGPVAVPRATWP